MTSTLKPFSDLSDLLAAWFDVDMWELSRFQSLEMFNASQVS